MLPVQLNPVFSEDRLQKQLAAFTQIFFPFQNQ